MRGYWTLIACNIVIPQMLWLRDACAMQRLFIISLIVNVGMWLERFVIVVISLHRDFLPSSWGMYYPTRWDWATYVGTIGLFLTLLFLFIRFLPVISIYEMRTLVEETDEEKFPRNKRSHGNRCNIFHHSTNTIARVSIYGAVFILALLGGGAVCDRAFAHLHAT